MEEIVSFLINEGYASDYNSATKIYEAMSEEWLDFILQEEMYKNLKDPEDVKFVQQKLKRAEIDPKTKNPKTGWLFSSLRKSPSTGITATGQAQSAPRATESRPLNAFKDMSNQTTQGKTRSR